MRDLCFGANNVSIEQHGVDMNFRNYKYCIVIYVKRKIEAFSLIAQALSAILGKHLVIFLFYET